LRIVHRFEVEIRGGSEDRLIRGLSHERKADPDQQREGEEEATVHGKPVERERKKEREREERGHGW
jgi:hypothetical protein